mgnify:CR=1 FL=1
MAFPVHRKRRLRATESIRALVRETQLRPTQFILPLFVVPGEGIRKEIGAMPKLGAGSVVLQDPPKAGELTAEEKSVARMMGVTEEAFKKSKDQLAARNG